MTKKKTSEGQIKELFEIVKGFNVTDQDGNETRFEATANKFVTAKDFTADQWKALLASDAIVQVEEPIEPEEIAAEIIEE